MKNLSLLHSVLSGLIWGGLFAILHGPVLPVLFLIEAFVKSVFYSHSMFGLTGAFLFWQILFFLGWIYFAVPSIIGAVVLVVLHDLASIMPQLQRASRWLSVITGGLVALVGISWFFLGDWAWSIQEEWLFAILITIWEIAAYAWLGRRLRKRHNLL